MLLADEVFELNSIHLVGFSKGGGKMVFLLKIKVATILLMKLAWDRFRIRLHCKHSTQLSMPKSSLQCPLQDILNCLQPVCGVICKQQDTKSKDLNG